MVTDLYNVVESRGSVDSEGIAQWRRDVEEGPSG